MIKDLLEKDEKLQDRTVLSIQNIIELLGFCLHYTYFSFQNKFYEQVEGVAMGSPVSPIVAKMYIEHFEREDLHGLPPIPPGIGLGLWLTPFIIQQQAQKQAFPDHINSIDPSIKFTLEGNQGKGAIPSLIP